MRVSVCGDKKRTETTLKSQTVRYRGDAGQADRIGCEWVINGEQWPPEGGRREAMALPVANRCIKTKTKKMHRLDKDTQRTTVPREVTLLQKTLGLI